LDAATDVTMRQVTAVLKSIFCVAFAILPVCAYQGGQPDASAAAKHPNYTGRWKMDKAKSDFGKFKAPDMIVRVVDEHEPTMNIHTIQTTGGKTTTSDVSYFVDGRETTNVLSGRDATSKSFWDGSTLSIRTETTNSKGEATQIVDRWDLSPDGQTLTITSHIETPNGEADLTLVCDKEKSAG
jgi:hypothetical protein